MEVGERYEYVLFQEVVTQCEAQTALSGFWTLVSNSISYGDVNVNIIIIINQSFNKFTKWTNTHTYLL